MIDFSLFVCRVLRIYREEENKMKPNTGTRNIKPRVSLFSYVRMGVTPIILPHCHRSI